MVHGFSVEKNCMSDYHKYVITISTHHTKKILGSVECYYFLEKKNFNIDINYHNIAIITSSIIIKLLDIAENCGAEEFQIHITNNTVTANIEKSLLFIGFHANQNINKKIYIMDIDREKDDVELIIN